MSDDQLPPQLIRYGPPYGSEKLPELTAEEIEAISHPSLYLTALKRIVQLEERHAALVGAARIKDAKIKALESTIELLRKGMVESCRDDRYEVMGGCVYAAELTKAARQAMRQSGTSTLTWKILNDALENEE